MKDMLKLCLTIIFGVLVLAMLLGASFKEILDVIIIYGTSFTVFVFLVYKFLEKGGL